jgi:hypothetical protein
MDGRRGRDQGSRRMRCGAYASTRGVRLRAPHFPKPIGHLPAPAAGSPPAEGAGEEEEDEAEAAAGACPWPAGHPTSLVWVMPWEGATLRSRGIIMRPLVVWMVAPVGKGKRGEERGGGGRGEDSQEWGTIGAK